MTFVVGDYRATELLGGGAFAQVWLGVRTSTGEPVAIKVFPPDLLTAVHREAALAATVNHQHVVSVLDVVGDERCAALVTEYAAGGDLADLLARRGRLSPGETVTVLMPLAAALATAHERQIIHGDISTQNVVFDRAGRPLLADLGAARAAAEFGLPVSATPRDAAPELARAGGSTPASDMFSLGSVALACLTGRSAWPADNLRDVLIQAAAGQWPDLSDEAAPAALVALVRALLEHDPERRPGAATVVLDLRSAGRPEPLDLDGGRRLPVGGGPSTAVPEPGPGMVSDQIDGYPDRTDGYPDRTGVGHERWAGRHGRSGDDAMPADSGTGTASGADEALPVQHGVHRPIGPGGHRKADLGIAGRARAVTRVRVDAPSAGPPADPRGPSRGSLLGRLGGSRAHPVGPGADRVSGRALRAAALVICGVLVAVLAGTVGLWWAGSDRADPVVMPKVSGAAAFPASASPASPPVRSSARASPDLTGPPPQPAGAPATHGSPTAQGSPALPPATGRAVPDTGSASEVSAGPPTARPPAASPPATSPPAASRPAATRPAASPPAATPAPASATTRSTSAHPARPAAVDWTATVRALDDARADALVARDPSLLDAVYTPGSTARSADVRTIRALVADGLTVSGARHDVQLATVLDGDPTTVRVSDSLPAYEVLDASGAVVGETAGRPTAPRVMVLVDTADGYRISELLPA